MKDESIRIVAMISKGDARVALETLRRAGRMPSGVLYKGYCRLVSKPVVSRAYRNYMKKMTDLGLVNSKGRGRWKEYEIAF